MTKVRHFVAACRLTLVTEPNPPRLAILSACGVMPNENEKKMVSATVCKNLTKSKNMGRCRVNWEQGKRMIVGTKKRGACFFIC